MQNRGKISIRYGSFSLSVEDIDNPYETIQRITDYFCKIAKDNPSFGTVNAGFEQSISGQEELDQAVGQNPTHAPQPQADAPMELPTPSAPRLDLPTLRPAKERPAPLDLSVDAARLSLSEDQNPSQPLRLKAIANDPTPSNDAGYINPFRRFPIK